MSRWAPSRERVVDAALLVGLSAAALAGLATTYTGWWFLFAGVAGVLLGIAVVHLAGVLRWPFVAPVVLGVAAYFLLGGPLALRAPPTPEAFGTLAHQLLFGWKELLTTLPPVDGDGDLVALPWALGLATGVLGHLLSGVAVRGRRTGPRTGLGAAAPLLAPVLLLVLVILLGVQRPASLWLQGAVVAGLALVWLGLRTDRGAEQETAHRSVRASRAVAGALMVCLAAALALPVAGWATGRDTDRVVLRTYVQPPFDVGRYPSPLASYRRYVENSQPAAQNLHGKELMRLEGVPAGTLVRFAALDEYDGTVWGASNDSSDSTGVDGSFQRVSERIDNPARGRRVEGTVTLGEGWSGVWLPGVGALRELDFTGPRAEEAAASFRYNLATSTGVVPAGLGPGDSWRFSAVLPDDRLDAATPPATQPPPARVEGGFLAAQAQSWSQGVSAPMERVLAIAEQLRREGKFSDGVRSSERIYLGGHHQGRLSEAPGGVNSPIVVGNEEQYAAWMALLSHQVGVPARVVMGAVAPEDGRVTGADVTAWVEVQAADGSWRTLFHDVYMDRDRPAEMPPQEQQEMSGTNVPPPAPIPPPSTVGEQTDAELNALKNKRDTDDSFVLPAWVRWVLAVVGGPLLLLLLVASAIVAAKAVRRRRRRRAPVVSARIAGGWRELVDHARDLGVTVHGMTRREQSLCLVGVGESTAAPALARTADGHVFGPAGPTEQGAAAYWEDVDDQRARMSAGHSRWRRLRAALGIRTLLSRS